MYCPNCGKKNKSNAKFCAKCGKKLVKQNNGDSNENNDSVVGSRVDAFKDDSKSSIGVKKIAIIAIVIVVLVVAVGANLHNSTQSDNASSDDTYEFHKNNPVMKSNHVSGSKDKTNNTPEEIHEVTESSGINDSVDDVVVESGDETNNSESNDEFLAAGDPSMENEESLSSSPIEIYSLSIEETSEGMFHVIGSGIINRDGSYTVIAKLFDSSGNAIDGDEVIWASDDEHIYEGESFTINGEIVSDAEIGAIELYVINQHVPVNGNHVAGYVDLSKSIYQERFSTS